jgi:hypothetical protein
MMQVPFFRIEGIKQFQESFLVVCALPSSWGIVECGTKLIM